MLVVRDVLGAGENRSELEVHHAPFFASERFGMSSRAGTFCRVAERRPVCSSGRSAACVARASRLDAAPDSPVRTCLPPTRKIAPSANRYSELQPTTPSHVGWAKRARRAERRRCSVRVALLTLLFASFALISVYFACCLGCFG